MVSFVIPTYNRATTINCAIECVLSQTMTSWELIIVDDGSSDNTLEVIEHYLKDDRIQYIYQTNSGVASARNNGASHATGDYLIFFDSDDSIEPTLLQKLEKNNYIEYDIIFWNIKRISDGVETVLSPKNLGHLYSNLTAQFLAGSVCYNRQIFLDAGSYDEKMTFSENYELGIRICHLKTLKILIIRESLATYYLQAGERSSNVISNKLPSLIHQYKKHKDLFNSSRFEKSKMLYFFGYMLEQSNRKIWATKFYAASWKVAPWKLKPFLKLLYMNL